MIPIRRGARSIAAAAAVATLLASPAAAGAQSSGEGYLFGRPTGSLVLRGGWAQPLARSDIFSFTTDRLTLSRGDFGGMNAEAELGIAFSPSNEVTFGVGVSRASHSSEFRHFIDNNDLPIEQTTLFRRIPVTASLKHYLAPRGRSIGQFAWIPSRSTPYVSVGGGLMHYAFRQEGDFVDMDTFDVFRTKYSTEGWTPMAQGAVGLDWTLSPRMALTGEAKYMWARGQMGSDFVGFDRIDLSGVSLSLGFSTRF
jgi:hypothetical protein